MSGPRHQYSLATDGLPPSLRGLGGGTAFQIGAGGFLYRRAGNRPIPIRHPNVPER